MYREARDARRDHSPADVKQDGQGMWAKRKSNEKDTYKLIVEVAERLFREIG